jgi:hypothetical protein
MHKMLSIIVGFYILLGCSNNAKTSQKTEIDIDSVKNLILAKENATLQRWYNGDPMGFIDNSWEDVTYFDPSLISRIDSIDSFRKLLTPIIGMVHILSHRLDKPMVQIFGDIAILTYTDVFALNTDTARWHVTEVYQCRNNQWKLIHSHWTESKIK